MVSLACKALDENKLFFAAMDKGAFPGFFKSLERKIGVERAIELGQIEVRTPEEVYFPDGVFREKRCLASIEKLVIEARKRGYFGLVIAGDASFLSGDTQVPGLETFFSYERKVTDLLRKHASAEAFCIYDRKVHSPDIIERAISVHADV